MEEEEKKGEKQLPISDCDWAQYDESTILRGCGDGSVSEAAATQV